MTTNKGDAKPNRLTLITLLLSSMIILMGAAAVAPALKPLSEAFPEKSVIVISLVVTLPALAVAITGLGIGYLTDRYGKAKIFTLSLAVFTLAGLSGYFLNTLESVLIGRFILGIGIAGISTATTALTAEYYHGAERGKVISYQSAAMGVGVLFLETIGGSLADIGWQEPFLIYLIGFPILILALASIREPVKIRQEESILPEIVITNKGLRVALCYSMIFVAMFLMFILPTNMPYHITDMGYGLFICGLMLGILGVSQAAFSLLYSRTSNKLKDRSAYASALLMIGCAYCLLTVSHIVAVIAAMILIGIGMGLITMTVIGSLSYYSQAGGSGKIMGGYSVSMNLGTFSSSIMMAPLITTLGSYYDAFLYISIFTLTLCAVFTISAIAERLKIVTERKQAVTQRADGDFISLYDSILIATDGSETSNLAVRNGLEIAKINASEVTALYVFDTEYYATTNGSVPSAEAIKNLSNTVSKSTMDYVLQEATTRGIKVKSRVVIGHPAEAIIEKSAKHSLVVCGSVGRTNVSRILLGSVAERVARMAACPVLICRKTQ
ncbi:MAG: MFS transporter [Candidatus Methanomethylophilaceae archaeon]|nr:MFS transporter [Candidatus Methanomethylophilaceae archaeon]